MNELKRQYNELLMRYMKAEYYFEDTSISNEDKEKAKAKEGGEPPPADASAHAETALEDKPQA